MSSPSRPPRLTRGLLEWVVPGGLRGESILGDLEEEFRSRSEGEGDAAARWWYRRQAWRVMGVYVLSRARRHPAGRAGTSPGGLETDEGEGRMRQAIEAWVRDLAHAGRSLLRAPGFLVVTVATLALAIGANTAIFSVVKSVLLDPLPFADPDRLVTIRGTAPGTDLPEEFGLGAEFYVQYREQANALADLALVGGGQTTVRSDDLVERLFVAAVSPSFFSTLGVAPVIGRVPTEADEEGDVLVLSHWLWSEWFGRDPAVVGRALEVSGRLATVVGVMGPNLALPDERTAVWVHDLPTEPIQPGGFGLTLVGRMAPGADHESLSAELAVLARRIPERFGGSARYQSIIDRHRPVVRSLEETLIGDIRGPLWILLGTVGIVLLVACANVANLLLVRAESRRTDLAVRRALGAGRSALIRSQIAEAFLLAALGGAAGVVLAWLAVPLLVRVAPESVPRLSSTGLDGWALLFTGGVVMVATCLAGLLPAIRFSNPRLEGGLRETSRSGGGRDHLVRDGLVVLQTASALVLLVASGLLFQSFRTLTQVDPGYDTRDIFSFQAAPDPREHGLVDAPAMARFHQMFMDRLVALPGVESVGLANTLPLDEGAGSIQVAPEATADEGVPEPTINYTMVGGDYFQTMGIELLEGRYLENSDQVPAEVEAIVSRATADLLWPGENAVGRRLRATADAEGNWVRVVGVVEDILLRDFRQDRADPMLYLPMVGHTPRSWGVGTPAYVMRTSRAEVIAPEVRELVREVAPEAPMYRIFTMRQLAARSVERLSFTMTTLAVAAGLALVLGAVGLFGVLSYVVSQRTREIGIRLALGARTAELRRMVVARGGRVALVGIFMGLVVAAGLTRVLESLLYGVGTMHLPTFAAMSALMLAVALLASYVPARRASSVDPMRSLRTE